MTDSTTPSSAGPAPGTPAAPTLVLGLVGGIASGKSTVSALLAGPDGVVIDADRLAHEVLSSPEVAARIAERFGPEAIGPDGRPDRAYLAARVFAEPEALRVLEGWIHPAVRVKLATHLAEARDRGVPRVVLDVPLLFENDAEHHLVGECDAVLFVDADRQVRERRVRENRGWSEAELTRREAAQLPLDEKRDRADHVIENHGDRAALERAVRDFLDTLRPS